MSVELTQKWDDLKSIKTALDPVDFVYQNINTGSRYVVYLYDGCFVHSCLVKDGETEFTDFVDNFLSTSKQYFCSGA